MPKIRPIFAGLIVVLLLSACGGATPQVVEVTRLVPQTVVVTPGGSTPPADTPAAPAAPAASPTTVSSPTLPPTATDRPIYYPLEDCVASRLKVGDRAMVTFGGGPNAIRSSPDVHVTNNIDAYADEGETVEIVSGPTCSYGWLLWFVKTEAGDEGWTPESDGNTFFLK